MRHHGVVDLRLALRFSADILEVWNQCARWPDAPPFSGGVFDSWPNRLAEGLAFCRAELAAVRAYERSEVTHG